MRDMKPLRWIWLVAATLVATISPAFSQPSENAVRHDVGGVASIEIPTAARIDGPQKGPDFGVFSVVIRDRPVLGLYLGSAADFPYDRAEFTKLGRCLALIVTAEAQGLKSRDVLVPFQQGQGFPTQLHMFYRDAAPEISGQADKIIASLNVFSSQKCVTEHIQEKR